MDTKIWIILDVLLILINIPFALAGSLISLMALIAVSIALVLQVRSLRQKGL